MYKYNSAYNCGLIFLLFFFCCTDTTLHRVISFVFLVKFSQINFFIVFLLLWKVKNEFGDTSVLTPEWEVKAEFELVADFPIAVTDPPVTTNTAHSSPAKSISAHSSPAKSLAVFSPTVRASKIKVPQMYFDFFM